MFVSKMFKLWILGLMAMSLVGCSSFFDDDKNSFADMNKVDDIATVFTNGNGDGGPVDDDNDPLPPDDDDNDPPGDTNPPGDDDNDPMPPGDDTVPTPPGDDNDPTPPGDDNNPTPPDDDNDPTPPGDDNNPTPPGDDNNPTPPDDDNDPPVTPPTGGQNPILDTTLRFAARKRSEGANVLLHVGHDSNKAVVVFDVPSTTVNKATLVLTVNAQRYGKNSGPSQNWNEDPAKEKSYIYVHRFLNQGPWVEGNGRQRGLENGEKANQMGAAAAQVLTDFFGALAPATAGVLTHRGDGAGMTANCMVDVDLSNEKSDCDGDKPTWAENPTDMVMGANGLPDGHKIAFDVTADVKAGFGAFLLRDKASGLIRFYSKEGAAFHGQPDFAPKLVIE